MVASGLEVYGSGDGSGYGDGFGSGYGSGDGSGDGFGSGYGYGYGDGDGFGYGSGYGSGDGFGYGFGYGSGYGDGSGYGYGYGSGDGSGDGDGSGYGDGDADFDNYISAILSSAVVPSNCIPALWRSKEDGTPANGGSGTSKSVGDVEVVEPPLRLCGPHALHGTYNPKQWKGDRWWIVALELPVVCDGDKVGSLKRTIIKDLGKCPW